MSCNAADPMYLEPVIETNAEPRGYKLCRCSGCGIVERCTPRRDFYSDGDGTDPNSLLRCERCIYVRDVEVAP